MLEEFRKIDRFHVPFCDVDMMRHVNNTSYLRWAETMRTDYFSEVLAQRIGGLQGMILARTEIVYEKPLAYRERVAIGARVSRIGSKSLNFSHEVWSEDRDVRCARIETTLVAMNYESGATIAVPPEWRERIDAFERHALRR